jgi:outer membrane protein OmpA-like peptidoglycan-associated protein
VALLAVAGVLPGRAQKSPFALPPVAGVSVVQTLKSAEGDRESVHTVAEATAKGLRWTWELIEVLTSGDTVRQNFKYAELQADLATAIRFRVYHEVNSPEEHPGYTMHALSRDVYRRLRAAGSDTFQVMAAEARPGGGMVAGFGLGPNRPKPIRWVGTLSMVTPAPVSFSLLLNGRRTEVPALHLRGRLTARGQIWEPQLWVLADSAYPLLLKWIGAHGQSDNVLQTVRVDMPVASLVPELERGLSTTCRAELPGIYFAFNSAVLDAASDGTIAAVAGLLAKHPDWTATLEGHTDSIGSAAANRALSERRVAAVRSRLVEHRVEGPRLKTAGFGSARPRETNTTIEGRARNRRVEMVRDCATAP